MAGGCGRSLLFGHWLLPCARALPTTLLRAFFVPFRPSFAMGLALVLWVVVQDCKATSESSCEARGCVWIQNFKGPWCQVPPMQRAYK